MAQFRVVNPDDVRDVLRAFALSGYRAHHPIAIGTVNTNVRVETDAGPIFLRVNEGKSEDDVRREAAIVVHAAGRGVPTPVPMRTPAGDPFAIWQGHLVSLFPWVAGRTLSRVELIPAHASAVGAALARLHVAGADFTDRRPSRYEPAEIEARLARITSLARPELAAAVATLGPELAELAGERDPRLPRGVIHGDLFVDNVMYDEAGRLVALIDFEQAAWGRFGYDLAVTTLAFGFGRDDFRPEIVRALLDAYRAVRTPTSEEVAGFAAELRFAACRFAVTRITDVHLKRDAGAAPGKNFQRYLDRLTRVRDHMAARDGLFSLG
jgi:homoserine kinase type II